MTVTFGTRTKKQNVFAIAPQLGFIATLSQTVFSSSFFFFRSHWQMHLCSASSRQQLKAAHSSYSSVFQKTKQLLQKTIVVHNDMHLSMQRTQRNLR